jgi:hypothetical protein
MSEGPSRPRGGSKTARHTAPRRGLGPLLPSRSRPLPRPPTRHVPASPAPRDLLPPAWPIFRPVPSTSPVQPARELRAAVCLQALPRQRPRHAESASSRCHVAERSRSTLPGQRLPKRGSDDGNAFNFPKAQEVSVPADDVVGGARHRTLEKLVVRRISAHADPHLRTDERGATANAEDHRAGLTRRRAQLAQQFRPRDDEIDRGQDRVGNEKCEPTSAPGVVDPRRDALSARERAPQKDLCVKNGPGFGQREPPRR